jgi:hypothetical protein
MFPTRISCSSFFCENLEFGPEIFLLQLRWLGEVKFRWIDAHFSLRSKPLAKRGCRRIMNSSVPDGHSKPATLGRASQCSSVVEQRFRKP